MPLPSLEGIGDELTEGVLAIVEVGSPISRLAILSTPGALLRVGSAASQPLRKIKGYRLAVKGADPFMDMNGEMLA